MDLEPSLNNNAKNRKGTFSMILSLESTKKFCSHLRIIVPSGQGQRIWRYLHYLSCKAMGLREFESLMLESNVPIYPNDYPLTRGYDLYQKEKVYKQRLKSRFNIFIIAKPFAKKRWGLTISD